MSEEFEAAHDSEEDLDVDDQDRQLMRWGSSLLVVFLIAALVAAMGFLRPQSLNAPTRETVVSLVNPLEDPELKVPLPFGAYAKRRCSQQCFAPGVDRTTCLNRCELLSVADFARRISPNVPTGELLGSSAVQACEAVFVKPGSAQEVAEGIRRASIVLERDSAELEYNRLRALRRYQHAARVQSKLRVPQESSDETAILVPVLAQALCARQLAAAAALAVLDRVAADDLYSELYFREFEQVVQAQAATQDERALALLTNFKPLLQPPPASTRGSKR